MKRLHILLKFFVVLLVLLNHSFVYGLNEVDKLHIAQMSGDFVFAAAPADLNVGTGSGLVFRPFSNEVSIAKEPNYYPSTNIENKLGISLRAGPDLGGDVEGGGESGIGREVPLEIPIGSTILVVFTLYLFVWLLKIKRHLNFNTKIIAMIKKTTLFLVFILFFVLKTEAQTNPNPVTDVLYVKSTSFGTGDGSSWDNAFDGTYLAWYLNNVAVDNTIIHVAEGVYYPYVDGFDVSANQRKYTFLIKKALTIRGGYSNTATGTALDSYDPQNNETRLSGDIGIPSDNSDNSINVVQVTVGGAILDGLRISNGKGLYHNGAGIMATASSLFTLKNSVVEDNYAQADFDPDNPLTNPDDPSTKSGGYGAAIHALHIQISDCIIKNNYSDRNGAGVYVSQTLILENSAISDNTSTGTGAGLVVGGNITFKGAVAIERNIATSHGGAMYIGNATFNVDDLISLKIKDCSGFNGGAVVFNGNTSLTLDGKNKDIEISGNSGSRGGAFSVNSLSSLILRNLTLNNNTATVSGGAINAAGMNTDQIILENVTFRSNTAGPNGGGALYSNSSFTDINKCTFIGNTANSGGAIFFTAKAKANVRNSTFSQNTSTRDAISSASTNPGGGGAIKVIFKTPTLGEHDTKNIIACTFNGNSAVNNTGHALDIGFAEGNHVNGNIIYGNGSDGTEISLDPETAIYNVERGTILQQNSNLHIESGKVDSIFTDIDTGDLALLANNGGMTQTFNIVKNGFAYNLVPTAIASTWGLEPTDQADNNRIYSCKMDAGSIELQQDADIMTYNVSTGLTCPNPSFDANTLITSRVNVKRIDYFSDAAFTTPITMPISVTQSTTVYGRVVSVSNCDADETLLINLYPSESTWNNNGNDSDWNNAANWSNGLPGTCTNVLIPSGKPNYPILDQAQNAVCDTIHFEFGGEVAKTNNLNYNSAKIDLTLDADKWYMLSPVLQQQYSGDYLEDQSVYRLNPEISIMYYQTGNPETGEQKLSSKFTGTFNTVDELLKLTSGHAIWVDPGVRPESKFTITFPKDSTKYAYYNNVDEVTHFSGYIARDKSDRFIYEGNASYQPDGSFSQTIENSQLYTQLIIGNPYMSHLDVVEFQRQNNANLEKSFRIWKNGFAYETYLITNDGDVVATDNTGGQDDFQIPPMQSFIIDTKGTFSNPLSFTSDMSITRPGLTLRSAKAVTTSDLLNIEVLREGVRQSAFIIRNKEGEGRGYNKDKDVWTMIPRSVGSYVSIYSLVDGSAASIHTTGDVINPIDLGISVGNTVKNLIKKNGKEAFTIQIGGNNKYVSGREVKLIDRVKNITHSLSQSAYLFDNTTGDVSDRFQIFTVEGPSSITDNSSNNNLSISYNDGKLAVISLGDNLIKSVDVYNAQGKLIYSAANLNTLHYSVDIVRDNNIVIVKVQTDNSTKTEKIIL